MWAGCLSRVFYPSILCLNAFIISTNIAQVTRSENWVLPGACWLNVVTSQFTNSPRGSFPLFLTFAHSLLASCTRVLSENLLEMEIMNIIFEDKLPSQNRKICRMLLIILIGSLQHNGLLDCSPHLPSLLLGIIVSPSLEG